MIFDASDPDGVDHAVALLRAGEVVAIPTDTLYGIAVDPFRAGAVDRLFMAKERPRGVALAVLISSPDDVDDLVEPPIDAIARHWIGRFWPGGLTIVLPRRRDLRAADVLDLGGDPNTIGVRCPDHRLVRELCRRVGPLATTSANRHGEATPPDAAGVAAALGAGVGVVLDGGVCRGQPSTVVAIDADGEPQVLREGRVAVSDLTRP